MDESHSRRHGGGLAVAISVAAFVLTSGFASATPPCPPFSYFVSYAAPFCNATLLPSSFSLPFVYIWWAAWWNGTPNFANGTGFERASDHVNQVATSEDRVMMQDRDGDLNLSPGDIVEVWSPGSCPGGLLLYFGPSATALSGGQNLQMQEGYRWSCGGSPPDYLTPVVLVAVVLAALAIPLAVVALRWRRILRP